MKIYIKTYGCQMNERDSDAAAAMLTAAGHLMVQQENEADLILLNTCSVRELAEQKAIGKLGILIRLKREKPNLLFGIMGCMAQSRGAELLKTIPHLNFAVGTDKIHELPGIVDRLALEFKIESTGHDNLKDVDGIDAHPQRNENVFSDFISIMRGCNRFCTYCIVPYARGRERSRSPEGIVEEARKLVRNGIREIMLLGQNVAAYGVDGFPIPDEVSPFADLLESLTEIDGLERIRFTSPHPAFFNHRLISAIAGNKKICKSIHLPLQSGSNRILKAMNRPYTAERYLEIVQELKRQCKDNIAFSTDIIVGFPTETEEDFEKTRAIMQEVCYDNAYIFKYSPRKGTKSAEMTDDVEKEEKERRNQILLQELADSSEKNNKACIGQTLEVLAEGPSRRNAARWSGRCERNKLVVFPPPEAITPGSFVQVRISRATAMTLYGESV